MQNNGITEKCKSIKQNNVNRYIIFTSYDTIKYIILQKDVLSSLLLLRFNMNYLKRKYDTVLERKVKSSGAV